MSHYLDGQRRRRLATFGRSVGPYLGLVALTAALLFARWIFLP